MVAANEAYQGADWPANCSVAGFAVDLSPSIRDAADGFAGELAGFHALAADSAVAAAVEQAAFD